MTSFRHCDTYIHDHKFPLVLRQFLLLHRIPAADQIVWRDDSLKLPWQILAKYKGKTVALVFASNMGDVGINDEDLCSERYNKRVSLEELSDFQQWTKG